MKQIKAIEYVKTHWKGFAIAGVVIVGGAAVLIVTKGDTKVAKQVGDKLTNLRALELERINALDWKVGSMTGLWDEGNYTNMIINDAPVGELKKLSEEFMKFEGLTDDMTVDMIIGMKKVSEN